MPKKQRKFVDDGWAVWIDGDDTSTVYINDWMNPAGKSYVDISIRIGGIKGCTHFNIYVPFIVSRDEIEDISLCFKDLKLLQAILSAGCIIDYKKNEHTSEVAFKGKTMDILHISTLEYDVIPLSEGTRISIDLEKLDPFIANDEAYIAWRMPHKNLNEIFKWIITREKAINRLRDLITSPVVVENYGYAVRINEARLLPEEITRLGAFHRQKLKKAVVTISINEDYELNDGNCYRIRHLEENLFKDYLPKDYPFENAITYEWNQSREYNLQGQFNFYHSISKSWISRGSMFLYLICVLVINLLVGYVSNLVFALLEKF